MNEKVQIEWKWGMLAALTMSLLALYPQIYLLAKVGRNWAGSYAYFDTDEVAYSSYLRALIEGEPRRNDPYSGRYDEPHKPLPESLFSVQFVPAYILAVPARLFGLSASTVFIILMPIVAFLSALAVFWLIVITTGQTRLATAGVLIVLCLGTFISGQGQIGAWLGEQHGWSYLPFLRRYIPAVPFPFFILVFGLVWKSVLAKGWSFWALVAGSAAIVAVLTFSYFYLWTATIAWLFCITAVWFVARPPAWKRFVKSMSIIGAIALLASIPYFILLSDRSGTTDQIQALMYTRSPDFFRPSELLSILCLILIVPFFRARHLSLKDHAILFVISLLLLPLVVFNQQIVTGRSLQPFHYEEFVTSYTFLMAGIILWGILRNKGFFLVSNRVLFWIAVISFAYGINGASGISRAALDDNILRDKTIAVANRLGEIDPEQRGVVLPVNLRQGEILPTVGSQPVLWAVHMPVFPGNSQEELNERFFNYIYYSGVSPEALHQILTSGNSPASSALFGLNRTAPHLAKNSKPVTREEIKETVELYANYIKGFARVTALKYLLSYIVIDSELPFDSSNIDHWYERDRGERVGDFVIYRVKLRP